MDVRMNKPSDLDPAGPVGGLVPGAADPGIGSPEHGRIVRSLRAVRSRARALLITQRVGVVLSWVVGLVVAAVLADLILRTPDWFRIATWGVGMGALGLAVWRRVVPAARFSPSLTEVALRIERSDEGRAAGLEGVLASGVELGESEDAARAVGVVREAGSRFSRLGARSVLYRGRTLAAVGVLLLIGSVAGGLASLAPKLATIGAERVLLPWNGAEWPKRTELADLTGKEPHPRGSGFLLRAGLLKNQTALGSEKQTEEARVIGRYRLIVDDKAGPVRRVLMTRQDRLSSDDRAAAQEIAKTGEPNGDADEPLASADAEAARARAVYEYLIEPWGLTPTSGGPSQGARASRAGLKAEVEFWFESDDDATAPSRVMLVEPPAVIGATARVVLPAYVGGPAAPDAAAGTPTVAALDLGAGADERATPPPILAGSTIDLTVTLNKSIPSSAGAEPSAEWIRGTLGADFGKLADEAAAGAANGFSVAHRGEALHVKWTVRESARVQLHLVDEYGISNVEQSAYGFDVQQDAAPQASVLLPTDDKTVLPTAVVPLLGEGRDDIGVSWVSLWRQVARPPAGSEGAPPEPLGDAQELARSDGAVAAASGDGAPALPKRLEAGADLDLATLDVKAGDEVWVTARAADAFAFDGKSHEPGRSVVRKLRVISQEQFLEQVWAELSGVRRSAITIAEEQARLTRETERNAEAPRLERSQASVTDRIARERETVESVKQRLDENGVRDETMQDILRQARQGLDDAGKSSVKAGGELKKAGQNEQQSGAPDQPTRQQAERAQAETQRNMEDLAELLDQGEDTWSMKRSVEKLLEDQKELKEKTGEIGKQTTGKQSKDLTQEERQSLEQASAEQKGLSQRAAEAIQKMMDAEQKVRKNDPAAADAMQQAAKQAQKDQVQQKMDDAAQKMEQNQTNSAQSQQQQAIDSMEQMLEQLKNTAKNRDEVLRRKLASLIESLEALIRDQESQLAGLAAGREKNDLKGLDRGMARLHQNTLGVLDEAAQGPKELAPVAEIIHEAADAQSASVVALRVEPVNADEAEGQEKVSLEKLNDAKSLAEKLDKDAANRQTARKRGELKKAYSDALARQVAMRQDTEALVDAEQNRRTKATARTIGEQERELQDTLAKMESQTKELSDAIMFSFAHQRLDESIGKAAGGLGEGNADRVVTRSQDRAVKVLQALVQALDEAQQDDEKFRQQQQPANGGGNQQQGGPMPLVPPTAEVKLLKLMQEEAVELTREAGESADGAQVDAAGKLQQDLADKATALIKKMTERRRGGGGAAGGEKPAEGAVPGEGKPKDAPPGEGAPAQPGAGG